MSSLRKAITTTRAAIIIAVIIMAAGAAVYLGSMQGAPTPTTTAQTTIQASLTTETTVKIPETLVIDDYMWPIHNLNALYQQLYLPWPWWLEHTVYQQLVVTNVKAQFEEGKVEYLPDLAEGWSISADSKTYTYNLRQGVKFSSGNPFNAYQVWTEMYAYYHLSGNSSNFLSSLFIFDMSNVDFGPASLDLLKSSGLTNPTGAALTMMQDKSWPIYTNGPYQIVFHTKAPFLHLNGVLVGFQGLIFDCQWAMEHGGFGTATEFNPYFDDHPIPGTGPYMVTEVAMNSHVKFEKNPNYWGNALPPQEIEKNPILSPGQAKTVVMRAVTDDLARYTDLTTGAAAFAAISATNWNMVKDNPKYAYFSVESSMVIYALVFNTKLSPTDNPILRQAIAHAIDYEAIWQKAFHGEMNSVVGPAVPMHAPYYNPGNLPPYDHNLTKARELLAKAGYPDGKGLPTLEIRVPSGLALISTSAELVQSNLAEIGINAVINSLSTSEYWAPYGSYDTNVKNAAELGHLTFIGPWGPSGLSPTDYWTSLVSSYSLWGNYAAYSDPVVDKGVLMLSQSGNVDEILSTLKVAQQKVYDDTPFAWIGTTKLWLGDGSVVWDKTLIKQVYFDPCYTGLNAAPLFNTIVFA